MLHRRAERFVAYGLVGWCAEVVFTGLAAYLRRRDRTLAAQTSVWMFPIYGSMAPLFESLHDRIRDRPVPVRLAAYGAGFLAGEYASGWLLRRVLGKAPWDYFDAKHHVHGLVRLDYFPIWALAGLAMERLHDRLRGRAAALAPVRRDSRADEVSVRDS